MLARYPIPSADNPIRISPSPVVLSFLMSIAPDEFAGMVETRLVLPGLTSAGPLYYAGTKESHIPTRSVSEGKARGSSRTFRVRLKSACESSLRR
jgi:hypothetical protein